MPYVGRVHSVFERSCNLVDASGWLVTLIQPILGNGPFSIVVDGLELLLPKLAVGEVVIIHDEKVRLGQWEIDLTGAAVWDPSLAPITPRKIIDSGLLSLLHRYSLEWPIAADTVLGQVSNQQLAHASTEFLQAIQNEHSLQQLEAATHRLVGLGTGLTPTGDDFLLGAMAGLWNLGKGTLATKISAAAIHRTTSLSAAYLGAAGRGHFADPWHHLAMAIDLADIVAIQAAVERVAQVGATSGRDGLAGFYGTLAGSTPLALL